MRQFFGEYRDRPKIQPLVREISWARNLLNARLTPSGEVQPRPSDPPFRVSIFEFRISFATVMCGSRK
jgi:hypothetical protein